MEYYQLLSAAYKGNSQVLRSILDRGSCFQIKVATANKVSKFSGKRDSFSAIQLSRSLP